MANNKSKSLLFFLLYLIFGLYFLNSAFDFVKIPAFILKLDKWILFIGGILILIGAFNFLRTKRIPKF